MPTAVSSLHEAFVPTIIPGPGQGGSQSIEIVTAGCHQSLRAEKSRTNATSVTLHPATQAPLASTWEEDTTTVRELGETQSQLERDGGQVGVTNQSAGPWSTMATNVRRQLPIQTCNLTKEAQIVYCTHHKVGNIRSQNTNMSQTGNIITGKTVWKQDHRR